MGQTEIQVVTRRQLATDPGWGRWEDPDSLAPIAPPKRKALLENPLAGPDDEPIQLLGTVDGRVAGRLDVVAGALEVQGEQVACHWGSALYVPEEYRNTLLGVKLIVALQRLHHTVGASGVSRVASSLYRGLHWPTFELPRFVLMHHSRPVVEKYLGHGIPGASARMISDAVLHAHGAVLNAWVPVRTRAFEIQPLDCFPDVLAPLMPVGGRRIAGHRSPAWINWLLRSTFDEPPSRRGLFAVVNGEGAIAGYFLVRARTYERATQRDLRNLHLGSLQDWTAFDASLRFEHIVLLAVRELLTWDVDAVEVCVPEDESSAGLRKLGFVRAGSMFTHVKGSPESPVADSRLAAPDAWRLRPAEGDTFFS